MDFEGHVFSPRDLKFLKRWFALIQRSYQDPDTNVAALARRMCLSQRQLYNKVKTLTKKSPNVFLYEYRIDLAKKLLRTEAITITQVAEKTGFGSVSAFSRRFRKLVNMPPSHYCKPPPPGPLQASKQAQRQLSYQDLFDSLLSR